MFSLIYSLLFLICMIVAGLIGFLVGKKYKWQYSAVKMIITAVATIIATFASMGIAWLVATILVSIIPMSGVSAFLSGNMLKAIFSMIIAPVLFYPVFALVRGLLNIAKMPLTKLFIRLTEKNAPAEASSEATDDEQAKKHDKKLKKQSKHKGILNGKFSPIGATLGALSGLMTFFVICIPIVCGIACIATPVASVTESMDGGAQIVHNVTDGVSKNAATVTMKIVGGEAVYNRLTTYRVDGHKVSLKSETQFIASFMSAINQSRKAAEAYDGNATAEAWRDTAEDFKETALIPTVLPEFLKNADEKWQNGEKYSGIGKPSFGKNIDPLVNTLIDVLANETFDTAREDVPTILNVVADISTKYPITMLKSAPMTVLGDEEVSTKVFKGLLDNERLHVMIPALTECGLGILGDKIAMHTDTDVMYTKMNDELASEISAFIAENQTEVVASGEAQTGGEGGEGTENTETDEEKRNKALSKKLKKVFNNNGINITDESSLALSANALKTFEGGNVSTDMVQAWLSTTPITVADLNGNTTDVVLDSAQTFSANTQVVDVDTVHLNKEKVTDTQHEAELLAHSFKQISEMFNKTNDGSELEVNTMIADLGPVLDDFRATQTIGPENTSIILIGILQSEKVSGKLKMPLTEVYDVADHINSSANKDSNYIELMTGLSQTVSVIDAAKGDDKAKTEGEVKVLLEDLTPASASTIQKISTPSLMQSYGVAEKSAEPTSELVSDVFGNLSDAKEAGQLSDEQYDAESKAVADMMNIAMSASSTSGKPTFGADSATGITAAEYIDRVTNSTVVSDTFVDTVYGGDDTPKYNPLNSGKQLSDTEKAEMLASMNSKLENAPEESRAALEKNLISAAAIVNFSVELTSSGFVAVVAA
ncbi:MAG: ECF transporter S component [Ruminococcaceae bacterium]|nr:ECF transporter S component [Oscillospiraceae bacterium]